MKRSLFPDGVLVNNDTLRYDANGAIEAIIRDRTVLLERGIRSGLTISVNPVNQQRLDITFGDGITPGGERVFVPLLLLPNIGAVNVPIADPSLGAQNFVYVFYNETKTAPLPHETNGTTPPTRATPGFVIQVMTSATFSALPLTDPDFTGLAQDRGCLIGIVTGTGGALLPGSIQQPPEWRSLKFATLIPPTISGVSILQVGDNTPQGAGTIFYDATGPLTVAWQAPGEAGPGAAVTITSEGSYLLTALGGSTVLVYVIPAALPAASVSMGVQITGIYDQTISRESGVDAHHRSLVGSGTPTPANPHGVSIDDIAPGFTDEIRNHQRFAHSTGITKTSVAGCLLGTVLEAPAPDIFQVQAPVGGDAYYVDGKRLTALVNNQVVWTDAVPGPNKELYEILVDSVGNVTKSKRLFFDNLLTNIPGFENQIISTRGLTAGSHSITYTSLGVGLGGSLRLDTGDAIPVAPVPPTGATYTISNGDESISVFLGDAAAINGLGVGVYTDTFTVNASLDGLLQMLLAEVPWTGTATGFLGYTANRGVVAARFVDRRVFGTVDAPQMRDNFLQSNEKALSDHSPDGIVIGGNGDLRRSLKVEAAGGLAVNVLGYAPVYVRGRVRIVEGVANLVLPNNSTIYLYVAEDGSIQQSETIPAFLSNPKNTSATKVEAIQYGAALASVTTLAGNVTSIIDLRRNISGGNVTVRPWSVGTISTSIQNVTAEFFDIRGALLYAVFATLGGTTPELQLMDAVVSAPIAVAAGFRVRLVGGRLILDQNAMSAPFLAIQGDVELVDVDILPSLTLNAPPANTPMILLSGTARLGVRGCSVITGGALTPSAVIEVASNTANLEVDSLLVNPNGHVTLDVVKVSQSTAANVIRLDNVGIVGTMNSIVNMNNALVKCSLKNPTDILQGATPLFSWSGAGAIRNALVQGPSYVDVFPAVGPLPNTGIGLHIQGGILKANCIVANLEDSSFDGLIFETSNPTLRYQNWDACSMQGCVHRQSSVFAGMINSSISGNFDASASFSGTSSKADLAAAGTITVIGTNVDLRAQGPLVILGNALSVANNIKATVTTSEVRIAADCLDVQNVDIHDSTFLTGSALWDGTAGTPIRKGITVRSSRFSDFQAFASVPASPFISQMDLAFLNNIIDTSASPAPGTSGLALADFSGLRIEGNTFTGKSKSWGFVSLGRIAGNSTGLGDADIIGNRFYPTDALAPPAAGWGHPMIYMMGPMGVLSTEPGGRHFRVEGNEVVCTEAATTATPTPLWFVQIVGNPASHNTFSRNRMRFADNAPLPISAFNWILPNTPLLSATRLALVAAVDSDPGTWAPNSTGHGRVVSVTEIGNNRIFASPTTNMIIAQVSDGTPLFTQVKFIFNSGDATSFIDAGGGGFLLAND